MLITKNRGFIIKLFAWIIKLELQSRKKITNKFRMIFI